MKTDINNELDEIAFRYGTDKSSKFHDYMRYYDRHFRYFRDRPLRMLEIGVYNGASIRTWEDYFPHANLYAIDIDPTCKRHESDRTKIYIGDQSDRLFLSRVLSESGPLHIVIDDGSHIYEHQLTSFESIFPMLPSGAIYAIEDLHTSYWPNWGVRPFSEFLKNRIDDINIHGKSTWANYENDLDRDRIKANLNIYELHIESMHFYPSLVFIHKR